MRALVPVLAVLAACGVRSAPDPGPPDAGADAGPTWHIPGLDAGAPPAAEMVLGEGVKNTSTLTPIGPDGEMEMWAGPQGGYHLFFQIRQRGLLPAELRAWARFIDPATRQVVRDQRWQATMVEDGGGWFAFPDALFFLVCPLTVPGWDFYDHDFEFVMRLVDRNGWHQEVRTTVRPTCPPGDRFCRQNPDRGCAAR